jgi:hypothetical protein
MQLQEDRQLLAVRVSACMGSTGQQAKHQQPVEKLSQLHVCICMCASYMHNQQTL